MYIQENTLFLENIEITMVTDNITYDEMLKILAKEILLSFFYTKKYNLPSIEGIECFSLEQENECLSKYELMSELVKINYLYNKFKNYFISDLLIQNAKDIYLFDKENSFKEEWESFLKTVKISLTQSNDKKSIKVDLGGIL